MIAEGSYKAKVVGCFTGESSEKKTPFYGIDFEIEVEGRQESIYWIAYLTSKEFTKDGKKTTLAKENIKTLAQLGFAGRSMSDLSDTSKSISELFNPVEGIKVAIEHEEFTKDDGTTARAAKVKWVNVGYGPSKFDHKQSVVKFKSLGLDGELMKLQKQMGTKKPEPTQQAEPETDFTSDDIPF